MNDSRSRGPRALLLAIPIALCSCPGGGVKAADPPPPEEKPPEEVRVASPPPNPESQPSEQPPGRWFKFRVADDDDGTRSGAVPFGKGDLASLGYSGAYEESGEFSGAVTLDADRIEPGLTLFCSGHDTSVLLIDTDGALVHHWHLQYDEVFPDPLPFDAAEFHSKFIRRAWAFPNGDLLAIFEYTGIARVDVNGKPIWSLPNQSHHDFDVQPDGTIVTLDIVQRDRTWMRKHYRDRRFRKGIVDSHVLFLSEDGELLRRISIFEAIHGSRFAAFLHTIRTDPADIFHANSVDLIDAAAAKGHPHFDKGDILVSLRNPSAVIVIDGETEMVKWIERGLTFAQHQASLLPSGSILLLDNCGGNQTSPLQPNQSRVIEITPGTQEIAWRYPRVGQNVDFFTVMLGYVERLPGGNTLITESLQGHLIEVSPEGDVVWEYYSPFRAGEDNELITTLMGARRIPRAALPFLTD